MTLTFNLEIGTLYRATFLPMLMFLGLFVLDLWVNNCQDGPRDIATLTFNLGGNGACR